jgi:hypothetical protein
MDLMGPDRIGHPSEFHVFGLASWRHKLRIVAVNAGGRGDRDCNSTTNPCTVTVSRLAVGSRQAGGSSCCGPGPGRALRTRRDRVKLPRGATKTAAAAADGAPVVASCLLLLFSRPALSSRPGSCPRLRSASSPSARRPPPRRALC